MGAAAAQPERAAAQGPAAVHARRDGHVRALAAAVLRARRATARRRRARRGAPRRPRADVQDAAVRSRPAPPTAEPLDPAAATRSAARQWPSRPASGRRRSSSRSARSRTAGTASPGTTARWSSSGTRCPASGSRPRSPHGRRARGSCGPTPSRSSTRLAGPGRAAAARTPARAAAAAATGSTSTLPAQRAAQGRRRARAAAPAGRIDVEAGPSPTRASSRSPGDDRTGWAGAPGSRYAVDADGRAGLRRHRSHDVVAGRPTARSRTRTSSPRRRPDGAGRVPTRSRSSPPGPASSWCCSTRRRGRRHPRGTRPSTAARRRAAPVRGRSW